MVHIRLSSYTSIERIFVVIPSVNEGSHFSFFKQVGDFSLRFRSIRNEIVLGFS